MNKTRLHQTFATSFNPRNNSLNALRLFLACLVIVSHSLPLGGYGDDPGVGGSTLGAWAVTGFFGISGYLITASRFASRSIVDFGWRRFLRVYPGFVATLLLVGFVLAPLSVLLAPSTDYRFAEGIRYVAMNLPIHISTYGVRGTLETVPYPSAWNGSLWTLIYEVGCYVLVGVLVLFARTRRSCAVVMSACFVVLSVACMVEVLMHGGAQARSGFAAVTQLFPAFLAGGLLYLGRSKVPFDGAFACIAGATLIVAVALGIFPLIAPVPMAYLMLWLGARLPLQALGRRNDLSYGAYIYAFPVQQMLVLLGLNRLPLLAFMLISIFATLPLAYLSWRFLESPAMRWKSLTSR